MKIRKTAGLLSVLVLLSLWMAGCTLERERSFKVVDDWSRGQRVGIASIRQPVGMALHEQDVYLLWSTRTEAGTRLALAHVLPESTAVVSRTLPFPTLFPRFPQLAVTDELHGFVVARFAGGSRDGVYHFRLSLDGDVQAGPERLSSEEQTSALLSVAQASDGAMHLLWDVIDGPGQGIYHLLLRPDGSAQGFPQLIGPGGEQPAGQVDGRGVLHAAWRVQTAPGRYELHYTTVEPGTRLVGEPLTVARVRIPFSDVTLPMTLGLDETHVYLLWSQEHRSGLSQGAADLNYVTFPIDRPTLSEPTLIAVGQSGAPTYQDLDGFPPLTKLVLPDSQVQRTDFLEGPSALGGLSSGAMIALADGAFSFRFGDRPQLVLLVFQNGELVGYQHPAHTRQYSQRPRGMAGPDGQLHMAWIDLEQPGRYSVYYASTAPQVRAVLDRRTANDNVLDAIDALWGMLSGFSLLPLVGMVLFPVLVICGVFYLTGTDDSLATSWAARLTLAVAIVVYLGAKMLVLAGMLTRPPLAFLLPDELRMAWVWIAALIVALIAGLVSWLDAWRKDRPFLFRQAMIFALTDSLLTLALYGPTFYGE